MNSRWEERAARGLAGPELLAYVSRLLGEEPDLVLHGGGNTSLKAAGQDRLGRPVRLIHVKPSGADLAKVEAADFTALRLDDLEPLLDLPEMADEALLEHVAWAMVDPRQRRPSIETLLHALLPDTWVLHSHADALLALASRPDGERLLRAALSGEVAVVPYRRPGMRLAQEVAAARRANPTVKGIVLMRHGLVTFGEEARVAYENHLAIVHRCEAAAPLPPLPAAPAGDRARAAALAPRLRGALRIPGVLLFDDSEEVRAFVADESLLRRTQRGPATSDHVLRTRRLPCIARGPEDIERYRREYLAWAEGRDRDGLPLLDPAPRVILAPGLGMWAFGTDAGEAAVARDLYLHTMRILRRAGEAWDPISSDDAFHAEYWPLQRRKLEGRGRPGELGGRVAWISGAAGGIGRAIARRFVAEGAHVVLVDVDAEGLGEAKEEFGPRGATLVADVSDEAAVAASFELAALAFGGVDIVVSNAGVAKPAPIEELSLPDWERSFGVNSTAHFLVARAALRLLRAQGTGGSFIFNASKNVPAPGAGFAAYSAAKAAETQLARVLALEAAPLGVRVNLLHPDAVFAGTRLWSEDVRRERARAHGVAMDQLEDFYAKRNLLRVAVRAEDVAEAALFFASDRSSRTTGCSLTIDGGVKEAFPR